MTTEIRTIKIEAYRDPDGRPTCLSDFQEKSMCQFLRFQRFGTLCNCAAACGDVHRDDSGFLRPVEGCPVWGGE